jgi:predicted nucleic acid-binding protein
MARLLLMDTGVLGMITHPKANEELKNWFEERTASGTRFLVPEICDYELRRELIRIRSRASIARLDSLKEVCGYIPIRTTMILRAAELWADARSSGFPTADDRALDGDMILAAQAQSLESEVDQVEIVTDNVGHLNRFVRARRWDEIDV